MLVQSLEDHTCQEDSRDEGGDKSDDQRRSEASDRTGTKVEEDNTRDDRREVRVEDRAEGIPVSIRDSTCHALTLTKLFLDTFVDKDVCIHRHTEG